MEEKKHCKWYNDEFCTNGYSPCVADYCPVVGYPELCKCRELDNGEILANVANSLTNEEVLKYYQPKIPENAVVLTDEEYERWQGQTLNIKKVRKETADKFAEKLKAKLIKADIGEGKYLAYVCEHDIDEICKEIIGEENGN